MTILRYKKYYYLFSGALLTLSVFALVHVGLPLGIDFAGGSVLEVRGITDEAEMRSAIGDVSSSARVQLIGEGMFSVRMEEIDEDTRQGLITTIKETNPDVVQDRFESVGPTVGDETKENSIIAIVLVLIAILAFIAFAFRRMSYPLSSWQYGVVTLLVLCHDVLVTVGASALFMHFTEYEVGVPFVAALLTVLGYSVNDTIVIFDRLRENLRHANTSQKFSDTVGKSTQETVMRSLNSSFTTLFVLIAIFIFGGASLSSFIFPLIIGVAIGTYSSIALASPLVVEWAQRRSR